MWVYPVWFDCISRAYTVMQLIGLYSFSSTLVFGWKKEMALLWLIDDVVNDFAEKVNITILMVWLLSTKDWHTCYFPQNMYLHTICIYHKKEETFTSWCEDFFLLIGEKLSFDSILLKITKASRVLYFFPAFGWHDLEQRSLNEAHAKYHRNCILLTCWLQIHIKMTQRSW